MIRKLLPAILMFILIADTIYSFRQYANIELDGDMADVILPSEWCQKVFSDPLGLSVLINNEYYAAPNRFFALWLYSVFFKTIPFFVQNFTNPVDSIYLTCAIAKTLIQFLILFTLVLYISKSKKFFSAKFLTSALLIIPFFIVYHYWKLGIIGDSITFAFSYSLPVGLTLLYFLPLFRNIFYEDAIPGGILSKISFALLAIVITLNGPIIPPVVLIISSFTLLHLIMYNSKNTSGSSFFKKIVSSFKKISGDVRYYLIVPSILSFYSIYIGKNNVENTIVEKPLITRYELMFQGLTDLPSNMSLLFPLIGIVFINVLLIRFYLYNDEGKKILTLFLYIIIGSLLYIFLLPIGGYRIYRPLIVRFDTLMPVTLSFIILFGLTVNFLTIKIGGKLKYAFIFITILFLMFYLFEDKSVSGKNKCQRKALIELSASKDSVVLLNADCTIMAWKKITDYKDSELNSELLKLWGVTKNKILYYQK